MNTIANIVKRGVSFLGYPGISVMRRVAGIQNDGVVIETTNTTGHGTIDDIKCVIENNVHLIALSLGDHSATVQDVDALSKKTTHPFISVSANGNIYYHNVGTNRETYPIEEMGRLICEPFRSRSISLRSGVLVI